MKNTFGALALLIFAPLAHALPISYSLDFTVQFLDSTNDPDVQIGNHYSGFFVVDDALLATDGLNQNGVLSDFFLQIEDTVWSLTTPSDFRGFRGPNGLFDSSPGFDVVGGEIVNVRGGVFGINDTPFVNFSVGTNNSFFTRNPSGSFGGGLGVAREPVAISEPTTLLLTGAGLLGLAGWRRRAVNSTRRE
jgi:hypothetical protein